jgi:hypothetical protein
MVKGIQSVAMLSMGMRNSLVGEIAVTVPGAAGAVNRNRRHNRVAPITLGCGLA